MSCLNIQTWLKLFKSTMLILKRYPGDLLNVLFYGANQWLILKGRRFKLRDDKYMYKSTTFLLSMIDCV